MKRSILLPCLAAAAALAAIACVAIDPHGALQLIATAFSDPTAVGALALAEIPLAISDPKKLVEAINGAFTELRSYVDKRDEERASKTGGEPDPLLKSAIEKANADITELRKTYEEAIKAAKRPAAVVENGKEVTPEEIEQRSAFVKFLRYGMGENGRAMMKPEEQRSLAALSDGAGGMLIPPSWEAGVLMKAYNMADLRPICNVATTGRDMVHVPSLKKPSVAWGVKDLAVTAQDLTTGGETIPVLDLKALTLIHNNTLDDSDANIWAELSQAFAMAIAEEEDNAFATGAGALSPQGVMTSSGVLANVTNTGVAAALYDSTHNGIDPLITALHALKKTYRRNATWAMNSATEGAVRSLKDANGQYLWQPPVQAGAAPTLLGRPVVNPEGMADIGANAYPIVLGDFRAGYWIRDRAGISISRLVERYAEYDQTGFFVKKRTGGRVVMTEAFRVVRCHT